MLEILITLTSVPDSQQTVLESCINQDLVGQYDKREESTIRQCKLVELICEAKLLGR